MQTLHRSHMYIAGHLETREHTMNQMNYYKKIHTVCER